MNLTNNGVYDWPTYFKHIQWQAVVSAQNIAMTASPQVTAESKIMHASQQDTLESTFQNANPLKSLALTTGPLTQKLAQLTDNKIQFSIQQCDYAYPEEKFGPQNTWFTQQLCWLREGMFCLYGEILILTCSVFTPEILALHETTIKNLGNASLGSVLFSQEMITRLVLEIGSTQIADELFWLRRALYSWDKGQFAVYEVILPTATQLFSV